MSGEANQAFARTVRTVEAGAAFTIIRNGKPVARLVCLVPGIDLPKLCSVGNSLVLRADQSDLHASVVRRRFMVWVRRR